MQDLPPDIFQEIAHHVGMQDRVALEGTSRTMRAAVQGATDRERAGLCPLLRIAFEIHQVMQQFVDPKIPPREFASALRTYVLAARARPGVGALAHAWRRKGAAELKVGFQHDPLYTTVTTCHAINLFVGYIYGLRIIVNATITPVEIQYSISSAPDSSSRDARRFLGYVTVTEAGTSVTRPRLHVAPSAWPDFTLAALKKMIEDAKIRRNGDFERASYRRVTLQILTNRLLKVQQASDREVESKAATRAIEECAASLHAAMW